MGDDAIPKDDDTELRERAGRMGAMGDYIISMERLSWLASLREFHQLEVDDDQEDHVVEALEMESTKYYLIGEELRKKLKEAQNALTPLEQAHDEIMFRVEKAKTSMEREETNRKETERLLAQEKQFKDNQISIERECMEQRFKEEIEKKERKWEWERRIMKMERETNSERLAKAESEIKEMMKFENEVKHMKKGHKDQISHLKADLKVDEEKWKVEIDKIHRQKIRRRKDIRSKDMLWAEDLKAKESRFGKEMAMKEMSWKTERHKLLKKNRALALRSSFTEHWIKDLGEQIQTVGAEILEKKRSLTVNFQALEEKCITIMRDQAMDPEPLKQLCRTKFNLSDMVPSANKKNSIWKVVDGWK